MLKNAKIKNLLLKTLAIILLSVFVGFLLMVMVYSIPTPRIVSNVQNSIDTYDSQLVTQWAGWTRYSHLSNTSDLFMISESICRPYNSPIQNALLNPNFSGADNLIESIKLFIFEGNETFENYSRYWHGNLVYIIPMLLITNAGGIRTIFMIVEFFLAIMLSLELGKISKIYSYIFCFVILFLNPITCALSYQNADIYIIAMVMSIITLKYNFWLKENNRYFYLFLLNGILVSYFDFLTYPMVAWGFPILLITLINKSSTKQKFVDIVVSAISWSVGYVGMWGGKWILASIFTNENVILDALNNVLLRTGGNNYSYLETLLINVESVVDVPMLFLYAVSFALVVYSSISEKKTFSLNKKTFIAILPYILIGLAPFVWYCVVRNHSYVHPWFEYRELAVTYFSLLIILSKLFSTDY